MTTKVTMPQMGESIAEGTLTRWFKKPGDTVVRDEPLFEISTDKVDAEVPAPADGILEQVLVAEGTTVEVNTVVALLGDGSGTAQAAADTAVTSTPATDPVEVAATDPVAVPVVAEPTPASTAGSGGDLIDVPMPQMGESIAEGTLTRWFKKAGDSIKRDEPLFEISTDKVDAEVPAPANGVLAEILVAEGTTVEVNTVVAKISSGVTGATSAPAAKNAPATPPAPASPPPAPAAPVSPPHVEVAAAAAPPANSDRRAVRSSPLVRKIAREHEITDLSVISGTGAGGRVTKNDILEFIARPATAPPAVPVTAPAATSATSATSTATAPSGPSGQSGVTVEKMSVMRRKIAEHMLDSRRTSAHVHSVFEADMTQIVSIRASKKDEFLAANGTKLTFMPFFLKACSDALRIFPHVNASIDGDDILVHQSVNIGIAVALDNGLIVPVIKGVQDLSIPGIQKSVSDLASRARGKQLLPDEVAGGTFTITNPGQFGGLFGIPIINQPQVAILGIGGIEKRPVVVDGDKIAIRDMTYLCLSYDHRLVDGALADQFMAQVKKNLESFEAYSVV
ncbi:MAG: 2-oxoglutarate dehydrogenase, E2 component, dihydrolipoamide succinyltransferase [Planctomycetota bacterium]|jgi:2-oxoglutarate dehydrogenase E2 component (dihydrolipoamide succinyltransferase)|nr:2-oxoglutarate dehydrogenase, E2 component, dihydrolipoamide succinyltransferase [Planctomycetota bacterium]